MNISQFQILLQEAIDNSTTTMEWLFLSRALASLNVGQIRTVSNFSSLPSAASNEGLLVWVTADENLYWSTGTDWYTIISSFRGYPYAWGCNTNGQIGDNTSTSKSSPVSVVGSFTNWCDISAGNTHNLAVSSNGRVWTWGTNACGELGDNSNTSRSSPVSVSGGFINWCQVSGGGSHSAALRENGTAWAWGANLGGQLGDNAVISRSSPVSVVGGLTDWCEISAGGVHTLAIRTNGTAWAWGCNGQGRLGDNTVVNKSSPVSVVGGFTDWCQVSGGCGHSVGLRTNGTIYSWGCNSFGQMGNGSVTSTSSPVVVVGGFIDWTQISAGSSGIHTLALRTNGTLWSWGYNGQGRLGDNTAVSKTSPVSVVGGFTNWCQASAGFAASLATRTNGTAWSWGINNCGQLGDNTITSRSSPVSIVGGISTWCRIAAGGTLLALSGRDFV